MLEYIFWTLIVIILYTYLGYPVLIWVLSKFSGNDKSKKQNNKDFHLPNITMVIAAYNEMAHVVEKMENTFQLEYPKKKLKIIWITDGSDDGSPAYIQSNYPDIEVYHQEKREGKTAAINRVMSFVKSEIVVFTDANTMLNKEALSKIAIHFQSKEVGCVAGEKRVKSKYKNNAGMGEGAYWKYESFLKKAESDFYSTLGAVGELYAIRKELFESMDNDIILDDFINSINIMLKGYKVVYEPKAFGSEAPSMNISEEFKRKTRIASGGFQVFAKLPMLFNIFSHTKLSFEFLSHKFLRWAVVPFSLVLVLILNAILAYVNIEEKIYMYAIALQSIFYLFALIGQALEKLNKKISIFSIPNYFVIMNWAQIIGFVRYINGKQSAVWDKVKRGQ